MNATDHAEDADEEATDSGLLQVRIAKWSIITM